jgi:hypothetical protein
MKGFVQDIERLAAENEDFRRVLYTAKTCQLVVMRDQTDGAAVDEGADQPLRSDEAVTEFVPCNTWSAGAIAAACARLIRSGAARA